MIFIVCVCIAVCRLFAQTDTKTDASDDLLLYSPLEQVSFDVIEFARMAEEYRRNGDYESASRLWQSLLNSKESGFHEWAAFWLGIINTSAETLPEDSPWGAFWKAIAQRHSAPWQSLEMLSSLQGTTVPDILKVLAKYWRGIIFCETKDFVSAQLEWSSLQELFPQNIFSGEIFYRMGLLDFDREYYSSAESLFQMAIGFHYEMGRPAEHWWVDEAAFLRIICLVRLERIGYASEILAELKRIAPESKYIELASNIISGYDKSSAEDKSIPPSFRADLLMREGWKAMDEKKYQQALSMFLESNDINPSDEAALYAAECAYRLKQYALADSLYSLVDEAPLVNYAIWGKAFCKFRQDKFDSALYFYGLLIEDTLFGDEANFAIAKTFYSAKKLSNAITRLGEYLAKYKKRQPDAMALLFSAQMEIGDTARAIEIAERYLRNYPTGGKREQIALSVAKAMFARQNFTALEKWVDTYSGEFTSLVGDSMVLLDERAKYLTGQYSDPLRILTGFMQRRPKSPLCISLAMQIASQFEQAKRWNDAIYAYIKAQTMSLPGDISWCESTLGILRAQFSIGDTTAAFATLEKLRIDGEEPWKSMGDLYMARWLWKYRGEIERPMSILKRIESRNEKQPIADSAVLVMGQLYFSSQRFNEASAAVIDRWSKMPKKSWIAVEYAKLLVEAMWESGRQDSALKFAAAVAESITDSCAFLVGVGNLAISEGRPELAVKSMDALRKIKCKNVPADFLLQMGDAFIQIERSAEACSLFNFVLQTHPNDSLGDIARKRLRTFFPETDTTKKKSNVNNPKTPR